MINKSLPFGRKFYDSSFEVGFVDNGEKGPRTFHNENLQV